MQPPDNFDKGIDRVLMDRTRTEDSTKDGYLRYVRSKWLFLIGMAVLLAILSVYTIGLGATDL